MRIRRVSEFDLQAITRIQSECYSGKYIESAESFAAKLAAHSDFSFVATDHDVPVGYGVALPWVMGDIPALNGIEYLVPQDSDSLYVHDIAVIPVARGSGVAGLLLETVLEAGRSRGYRQAFLVAVQGAVSYWKRYGFEAVAINEELQFRLAAYGENATYMVKSLRMT